MVLFQYCLEFELDMTWVSLIPDMDTTLLIDCTLLKLIVEQTGWIEAFHSRIHSSTVQVKIYNCLYSLHLSTDRSSA